MSLQLVDPPKAGVVERLIAAARREPLAAVAVGIALMALYAATGRDVSALEDAARIVLSAPMTTGTSGP